MRLAKVGGGVNKNRVESEARAWRWHHRHHRHPTPTILLPLLFQHAAHRPPQFRHRGVVKRERGRQIQPRRVRQLAPQRDSAERVDARGGQGLLTLTLTLGTPRHPSAPLGERGARWRRAGPAGRRRRPWRGGLEKGGGRGRKSSLR